METIKNGMLEALSEHLQQQRLLDRRKFSLRSVAERINVSHSMLSQILKGKKRPSPLLLRRLCEDLGMNENQKLNVLNDLLKLGAKAKKYLTTENDQGYKTGLEGVAFEKSIQLNEAKSKEQLNELIAKYIEEVFSSAEAQTMIEGAQVVISIKKSN